jgi:hypothetical protein
MNVFEQAIDFQRLSSEKIHEILLETNVIPVGFPVDRDKMVVAALANLQTGYLKLFELLRDSAKE